MMLATNVNFELGANGGVGGGQEGHADAEAEAGRDAAAGEGAYGLAVGKNGVVAAQGRSFFHEANRLTK